MPNSTSPRVPNPPPRTADSNTSIPWLLGALIMLALGWWLWPRDASEPKTERESASTDAPALVRASPAARPALAQQAKASLSGTVRERGGGPLADAQVCAMPDPDALRGLDRGAPPRCVRTDADGHYHLAQLWPVRTRVSASAVEHVPMAWSTRDARGHERDHVALAPDRETSDIDFELAGGGVRLTGVVEDFGGGVIEGALVGLAGRNDDLLNGFATSDGEGRFELWAAPGEVMLRASAEGYASSFALGLAPSERVEIRLIPESVLVGRVVDARTGEPLADLAVSSTTGDEAPVRSDAEGGFRIDGLHPGVYKPVAVGDEWFGQAAVQVHLGLGQTSAPVEIRVHPMALVEGRIVVAGTREGCSEGRVVLRRADNSEMNRANGDDEGRLRFPGLRPGEYDVEVTCRGFVADEYPNLVVGESIGDLVWEVREGLAIRGEIVDAEGRRVEGLAVLARAIVDGERARSKSGVWVAEADHDGSFALAGLTAGRYELEASGGQPTDDTPVIVELSPGVDVDGVRIELPATGTLIGRLVDEQGEPQPGVPVAAGRPGKRPESRTQTDDAGNFRLERVRAGSLRVFAERHRAPGSTDDDVQGEQVEVGAGETVEVELRIESRHGLIRGTVLDEHGAPVDDAFIEVERLSDSATASPGPSRRGPWGSSKSSILSEVDGRFTIEDLAPGDYVVRALRRGGGEAVVDRVALGSDIELTIAPNGLLAGTIVVPGGSPPEKFLVTASDSAQNLRFSDDFFRSEGRWQLAELPVGSYEVVVDSSAGTATLALELAAGERHEDLELVLQPRVTVRGRLIDIDSGAPVSGIDVEIRPRKGGYSRPKSNKSDLERVSDAEGRFEVELAPTGEVRIAIRPRGRTEGNEYLHATILATIANTPAVQDIGDLAVVRARLGPDEAMGDLGFATKSIDPALAGEDVVIEVGLIHPGGPASATTLAVGDVITSVDGKSVSGLDSWRFRALTQVPVGTALELGLTDGRKVSLTVGPAR